MLLERGFLRPRARRSRRRSAHRSRSSPIPPVTCVGRDSMSPPSSPTRTPSTAGGLRRGEGLRLLRWPTAPSSSMGSIRFRSGGAAREAAAGTLGSISGFPSSCAESTDLAHALISTLQMSWHQLKASPVHGGHHAVRARYSDFAICSCGGILQISRFVNGTGVPRLRRGRLAGRALSHPLHLARSKERKAP